ncbi:MAG: patatin-like phospholipase family protein [Spirochaetaceae bacterium]|jgi:NTE family protein|uniref:patatin-like phospholipase family protein n=1 Tax=Sphaerochaeta halotolerans TaxID=2293840 RepID=UPI0014040DFA|nr:patatin-like phospholipase family protein [Sphaerochaeta halotolerans]MBG0767268.1 patatin-like phospholipase family protein [Spirochaetaceae bacterium]
MEEIVETFKKLLVMALLICMVLSSLAAAEEADDILLADVPITYGDATFRERILARTQGERSPVGLVLSGGSARAFAHIGVLKYLEEQGIVPDFIISNSMGSIVGLLYAAGLSPDQILESITSINLQSMFDLTLPVEGGVLESSRFIAKVASIVGSDLQLETLPIPIIVVAEDLVTKRQIAISEGDFFTVLQASYALPVYFPPVEYRGHLLIDGGITNLAPIDLAYSYADSVIVSTTFYDMDTLNLKNPLTVLNVSIDIGKRRKGVEELKNALPEVIWIRCAVEDVSFMEFDRVEYLVEQGYRSASEQQEQLSTLHKSAVSQELSQIRSDLALKMEESATVYRLYQHVPLNIPSTLFGLGLDSDYQEPDTSALKDDTTLGFKFLHRKGDISVSVNPGYSFDFRSNERFSAAPAVRAQFDYTFLKYLRLSLYSSFLFDVGQLAPILSSGVNLEGRIFVFDEKLRISLLQSYEQINNFEDSDYVDFFDGHTFLYTISAIGTLYPSHDDVWVFNDTALSLSYQILGDFSNVRSFAATHGNTEVLNQNLDLFASINAFGRFALDGKGDVPFFFSDGFRTTDSQIKSQGHDLTVSSNPANHLVGLGVSVGYRPSAFNPTMAELFIFQNNSVAIYSDLLWNRNTLVPYLSLGLELHSDLSLLGIRTLPLTIYGGWDQRVNTLVWGFYFNVAF